MKVALRASHIVATSREKLGNRAASGEMRALARLKRKKEEAVPSAAGSALSRPRWPREMVKLFSMSKQLMSDTSKRRPVLIASAHHQGGTASEANAAWCEAPAFGVLSKNGEARGGDSLQSTSIKSISMKAEIICCGVTATCGDVCVIVFAR